MTGQENRIATVNTLVRLLNHFEFSNSPFIVPFAEQADNRTRTRTRVRHVDQAGRLAHAYDDLHQMALQEFHAGLHDFEWGDFGAAARHFRQAGMHWSMTNQPALLCLTAVARGGAYHAAHGDEEALNHYARARRQMESLQRHNRGPLLMRRDRLRRQFLDDLEGVLDRVEGNLAEAMHADFPAGDDDDATPTDTNGSTGEEPESVTRVTLQDGPGRRAGDPQQAPPEDPRSERFVIQEGRDGQPGTSTAQAAATAPPPIVLPPDRPDLAQENRELRQQLTEARAEIADLRREMAELQEQMARFTAPRPGPAPATPTPPRAFTTDELLRKPPPLYVAPEVGPVLEEETKPDMPVPDVGEEVTVPARPGDLPPYLTPGENQVYFRVEQKDVGRFLPDVKQGDWVLVDIGQREPRRDDYIVLGDSELAGSVIVDEPTHPQNVPFPLHVAQFVRETDTGRVHIVSDNEMSTYALEPDLLVGLVVGFFRTVAR